MNLEKIREAKSILNLTLNTFFSQNLDSDTREYIRLSAGQIRDLLEVTDRLLFEGLLTNVE